MNPFFWVVSIAKWFRWLETESLSAGVPERLSSKLQCPYCDRLLEFWRYQESGVFGKGGWYWRIFHNGRGDGHECKFPHINEGRIKTAIERYMIECDKAIDEK